MCFQQSAVSCFETLQKLSLETSKHVRCTCCCNDATHSTQPVIYPGFFFCLFWFGDYLRSVVTDDRNTFKLTCQHATPDCSAFSDTVRSLFGQLFALFERCDLQYLASMDYRNMYLVYAYTNWKHPTRYSSICDCRFLYFSAMISFSRDLTFETRVNCCKHIYNISHIPVIFRVPALLFPFALLCYRLVVVRSSLGRYSVTTRSWIFSGATGKAARSRAATQRDSWSSTCGAASWRERSCRGATWSVSRRRRCSSTTRSAGKTVRHDPTKWIPGTWYSYLFEVYW